MPAKSLLTWVKGSPCSDIQKNILILIWVFKSKTYQEIIHWEFPAWIQTSRACYKSGGHCYFSANNNYPANFWALMAWRKIWFFQLTVEELCPQRFRAITKESETKKPLALIYILNRRFTHTIRPFMWTPEQSMLSLPWSRRLDLMASRGLFQLNFSILWLCFHKVLTNLYSKHPVTFSFH